MPSDIQILILAAGKGRRMGSTKQLLPYRSHTLIGNVIDLANSLSLGKPLVILGYEAEKISSSIDHTDADVRFNPNWQEGMGNTLAYGVKEGSALNPHLQAILVLLADQPRISKTHLLNLIKEYKLKKGLIISTKYPGGGGVPAIFDHSLFPNLMSLKGKEGARKLIRRFTNPVMLTPDKGEVSDVDTPEDYQQLLDLE